MKAAAILSLLLWAGVSYAQIPTSLSKDLGWINSRYAQRSTRPDTIKLLEINDPELTQVPEWVYGCTNLRGLSLKGTRIRHLPARLGQLSQLCTLNWNGSAMPWLKYLPKSEPDTAFMARFDRATEVQKKVLWDSMTQARAKAMTEAKAAWQKAEANHPTDELTFDRLDNITFLDLSEPGLAQLPPTLTNLPNLEVLSLNHNGLTAVPRQLKKLTKLTALYLNYNQITLRRGSLRPLRKARNLQNLTLAYNRITQIPRSVRHLKSAHELIFSGNALTDIHPKISKLQPNLKHLLLYGTGLATVPNVLFKLTNLEELDLYHNRLQAVSPQIGQLKNLRLLYLSYNNLRHLPDELGQLTQLRELYAHHNQLRELPPGMANLASLEVAFLQHNNLAGSFPSALLGLKNLRRINLEANQLGEMPEAVLELPRLQFLRVNDNLIPEELKTQAPFIDLVKKLEDRKVNLAY
ncbi:MAG: leucine-rich repeat domain-containing protein [Bernardetiaceae bacterium]|jgi:Leucine-rich repeat (LRR) protein|nr:leucine-rich repeat domain-containing protein [Bernardetiaceae bacterium]